MWGTDPARNVVSAVTTTWTGEGQAAVFIGVDHQSAECVGIHAARRCFGAFGKEIAQDLAVRHDHGSQYMSDAFQKELAFLGIESSPAFVRAPEGNGCAERFIRTLKENLLWMRTFDTVEQLLQAPTAFRDAYNATWLIERHGFRPPTLSAPNSFQPRRWPRRVQTGVSPTAGDTAARVNGIVRRNPQ